MANFRGPFFIKINYHSDFAPHAMQIPIRDYTPPFIGFSSGAIIGWDDTLNDADAMITSLVSLFLPFFGTGTTFDNYLIYHQALDTDPAVPQFSNALSGMVGTVSPSGWDKATQMTSTWRSTTFGLMKLVFLDFASEGDFGKIQTLPGSGDLFNLDADLTGVSNGWKAQDNGQPLTFISATKTLNEKLRRAYRET